MDKQALIQKIQQAQVSDEFKQKLTTMVEQAPVLDQTLTQSLQKEIDSYAQGIIEEVANAELEVTSQKYSQELQALEDQVSDFSKQLNQKADEIDLQSTRSQLS